MLRSFLAAIFPGRNRVVAHQSQDAELHAAVRRLAELGKQSVDQVFESIEQISPEAISRLVRQDWAVSLPSARSLEVA